MPGGGHEPQPYGGTQPYGGQQPYGSTQSYSGPRPDQSPDAAPGWRDGHGTAPGRYDEQPGHGETRAYGGGTYGSGVYGGGTHGGSGGYAPADQFGGPGQRGEFPQRDEFGLRGEAPPMAMPKSKSRRGLIIGICVAAALVVALGAVAIVLSMSKGTSYAIGSCVKQSGDKAVGTDCSSAGAYQITKKVNSSAECPDQAQPYVIVKHSGAGDDVLCLKPAH